MKLEDLPKDLKEKVENLMYEGDDLQMGSENLKAIEKFKEAYDLIPEPKNTWILASVLIGDIAHNYYLHARYEVEDNKKREDFYFQSLDYYKVVMEIPQNVGNARNHLKVGRIRYELGDYEKARDEFIRFYMAVGIDGFEYEDPKYFELIRPLVEK